jgi:drug/metabolite transporter (DMT)-like permease
MYDGGCRSHRQAVQLMLPRLVYHRPMKLRRILAAVLIVLGAVLMLAAPESTGVSPALGGIVLIVLGVLVEAIGIALERRR